MTPREPAWQQALRSVYMAPRQEAGLDWPAGRVIFYLLSVQRSAGSGHLVVMLRTRDRRVSGSGWCQPKPLRIEPRAVGLLPDPDDRDILSALSGAVAEAYWSGTGRVFDAYRLESAHQSRSLLPRMVRTGRCVLADSHSRRESELIVRMDPLDAPWRFACELVEVHEGYALRGGLRRGGETRALRDALLCLADGWVLWGDGVLAPFEAQGGCAWIEALKEGQGVVVPRGEVDDFLAALVQRPDLPPLHAPPALGLRWQTVTPTPRLCLRWPRSERIHRRSLLGELTFLYGEVPVNPFQPSSARGLFDSANRIAIRRDDEAERARQAELTQAGFRLTPYTEDPRAPFEIAADRLPRAIVTLAAAGWRIERDGQVIRPMGRYSLAVSSGMDWFEVRGRIDFDGATAEMPALLEAARTQTRLVTLSDGSTGLLDEAILKRLAPLLSMGEVSDDAVRFTRTQASLLDALLAAEPDASCDETFQQARDALRGFTAIEPVDPPATFQGELRPYQRDGLGWLRFLQRFGFGGCLADDMGLGKTVQVLALLEDRRQRRAAGDGDIGPSLVVVPRSLVFNWKQEALRFTPHLRIIDHTGIQRVRNTAAFSGYDVALTTYGTLRADIAHFKDFVFDYIILDEAQAIKNVGAQTTKAARLLKGRHRLALSGTPVQNHLGELWSLFDVLNPGLLGTSAAFRTVGVGSREADEASRALLARVLRPFILRRTKAQVARDLPERTEETIYCEMEKKQAADYRALKEYYRNTLLTLVKNRGMNRSKIQVLEALLRLRQAACHPALIDPDRGRESSAKLAVLMEQLDEVLDGGHKALVFSQFTSFLAIVRRRLESRGWRYEYLDGQTTDRQAPVERFQNDPDSRLFLVSLKAGGLGLNLTAAEYVFLLDPWWNPAIEAQAVDRAHRIGQTRRVFAYRLIAKDTVEEKVLALQETKRKLADSIIGEDNSLIRDLTRDDLALLLS